MSTSPGGARLAIGLPVRNGENYLEEALACLLAQTFTDFRLFIADNASTDRTEQICRAAAARDPRVVYVRHPENIGAAPNFNFVFNATESEYFKWAAHDDLCEPAFLARCIECLDADPGLVLCHSYSNWVDGQGRVVGPALRGSSVTSRRPSTRLQTALEMKYPTIVWGVMRREAAAATQLIGSFVNSDRYFLGELLLRGGAEVVEEPLFKVRRHDTSFSGDFYRMSFRDRLAWFDPKARLSGLSSMARTSARLGRLMTSGSLPIGERAACAAYLGRRVAGVVRRRAASALGLGEERRRERAASRPAAPLGSALAPASAELSVVSGGAEAGR